MCGRFTFIPTEQVIGQLGVGHDELSESPRYNVAPGAFHPVIIQRDGHRQAQSMRWGLVPSWAKDPKIGYKMINARAEGIFDKPSFRKPVRSQRCLVPASGFYEWRGEGKNKQPFYFKLTDQPVMVLAGLYDVWHDAEDKPLQTFTIITTAADALMQPIHDRMPAILPPNRWDTWLDPAESSPTLLETLLKPYQQDDLNCFMVSKDVNSAKVDNQTLIAPLNSA